MVGFFRGKKRNFWKSLFIGEKAQVYTSFYKAFGGEEGAKMVFKERKL